MTAVSPVSQDVCTIHSLLSNSRRCQVLQYLATTDDESVSVRTVARNITAVETGLSVSCARGDAYKSVYAALIQGHLEALAAAGVIVYHPDRRTIACGPAFELVYTLYRLTELTEQLVSGPHLKE